MPQKERTKISRIKNETRRVPLASRRIRTCIINNNKDAATHVLFRLKHCVMNREQEWETLSGSLSSDKGRERRTWSFFERKSRTTHVRQTCGVKEKKGRPNFVSALARSLSVRLFLGARLCVLVASALSC